MRSAKRAREHTQFREFLIKMERVLKRTIPPSLVEGDALCVISHVINLKKQITRSVLIMLGLQLRLGKTIAHDFLSIHRKGHHQLVAYIIQTPFIQDIIHIPFI